MTTEPYLRVSQQLPPERAQDDGRELVGFAVSQANGTAIRDGGGILACLQKLQLFALDVHSDGKVAPPIYEQRGDIGSAPFSQFAQHIHFGTAD